MSGRFWFYLGSLVVIAGLYSWRIAAVNAINNEVGRIEQASLDVRHDNMSRYVDKQTDERKLVSLAKRIKYSDAETLRLIIDRAYAINPSSRDITILASTYHPEIKEKILELDPLYKE